MRRIGICTLYYENKNYGANLQAYALQSVVAAMGMTAELLCYHYRDKLRFFLRNIKNYCKPKGMEWSNIRIRNHAIDNFNKSIPHSRLYFVNTIKKANDYYDIFITGSDQVWNPDWINPFLALEFTDASKKTIAYAASTGKIRLNREQQTRLKRAVDHTDFISIREAESIPALQELTSKPVEYVLDPTLLLSRDEWNVICSDRIVQEEYMFCYFLGNNGNLRNVAREYAKKRGLKLVTLPYLNGRYRQVDDGFGDNCLYDVSPKDFISLIKYASFVMTDSFHAAVFSHIYEREFVVSGGGKNEMGCRMISLTKLFGTEERYIREHDEVTVEVLSKLENISSKLSFDRYEAMKKHSLDFLKKVLEEDGRDL